MFFLFLPCFSCKYLTNSTPKFTICYFFTAKKFSFFCTKEMIVLMIFAKKLCFLVLLLELLSISPSFSIPISFWFAKTLYKSLILFNYFSYFFSNFLSLAINSYSFVGPFLLFSSFLDIFSSLPPVNFYWSKFSQSLTLM